MPASEPGHFGRVSEASALIVVLLVVVPCCYCCYSCPHKGNMLSRGSSYVCVSIIGEMQLMVVQLLQS